MPAARQTRISFRTTKRTKSLSSTEKSKDNDCVKAKISKITNTGVTKPKKEATKETLLVELNSILTSFDSSDMTGDFQERKEQLEMLNKYLVECVECKKSPSVYVCGLSGTGKTAALRYLQAQPYVQHNFIILDIDCFAYQRARTDVYKEIITKLGGTVSAKAQKRDYIESVKKLIKNAKKPVLMILDEIDALKTKDQEILYSLFELPALYPNGEIVLMTVGNIIDFIDRHLPRLKKRDFKPAVITFTSYTNKDIMHIIQKRLNKVKTEQIIIEPEAVMLLGMKVASVSGNARMALDCAKEVIEKCVQDLTTDCVCTISVHKISLLINKILDEDQNTATLNHLPTCQKLMVAGVARIIRDKNFDRANLTIFQIENSYKKICRENGMAPCHSNQFVNLFSLIASTGMFSIAGKKNMVPTRDSKVTLNWDEYQINKAFEGEVFFGSIVAGVSKSK